MQSMHDGATGLRLPFCRVCAVLCWVLALVACVPYKPALWLEKSPETIPATVKVQPLSDLTPPDDKVPVADGVIAQTGTMEGDLSGLVTKAISADFSATAVFRSIRRNEDRPQLILGGTIRRFYGQAAIPFWLRIPGVNWMVNALVSPVQAWQGEVDLEVTLATPDGRTVGTYRGRVQYQEIGDADSRSWSMPLYPAHVRLNQAFTDAMAQIRDQILRDKATLLAAIRS